MIDISAKKIVERSAKASGKIILQPKTIDRIKNKKVEKGDAFTIAKISAINTVKKVPDIISFCHPIPIDYVNVGFQFEGENSIKVTCNVKGIAKTGVEMEALAGVTLALLNIWDVVKKYEKDETGQYPQTLITDIKVEEKLKKGL
ncbi:MAG: cyclic pyranopterin monophosphate synthase MoaC [Candidatus Lokiarchaeota archaeon]|jgi:cyclic pyranopterin phosphate synthase